MPAICRCSPIRLLVLAAVLLLLGLPGLAQNDEGSLGSAALGFVVEGASGLPPAPEAAPRMVARVTARWADVEPVPGNYDWSTVAERVEQLQRDGYRVALCLTGVHPDYLPQGGLPSPARGESHAAWVRLLEAAVRRLGEALDVVEIWQLDAETTSLPDAAEYAFLLKSSAVEIGAESTHLGLDLQLAQLAVPADRLAWQQQLWLHDVAAYIDVLPIRVDPAAELDSLERDWRTFLAESLRHPPASTVWIHVQEPGQDLRRAEDLAIRALAAGVPTVLLPLPASASQSAARIRWAAGVHATLAAGYAPAPLGDLRIEDDQSAPVAGATVLGRFFSDRDFTSLIYYRDPVRGPGGQRDRLIVDSSLVRNVRIIDPQSGDERRTSVAAVADQPHRRAVRIESADHPMGLRFEKGASSPLPPEAVETDRARELTAEEIIANNQLQQGAQDERLERVMSRGRIDFHFRLAQGAASIDVAIDSNYFWERGGQLEWEQTAYFINGNKANWKKFPRLPLIQPEKVITLPLDLTLDRTYRYKLVGRDRVGDREAYVLAFQPTDPDAPLSLYRGRVWIDTETFVRLKASVVQTGLEAPVLSNEEVDRYRPHVGPDGETYWLLTDIDGQQNWSAGGRVFIVQREVTFSEFRINPPKEQFDARREQAYASGNVMLRDTDEGFRYLERTDDGTRELKAHVATSQLFGAAGAFADASRNEVSPLLGVNYFNYDLFGSGFQFNALFAGVLGFFTASKPDMFGKKIDFTGDLGLTVLKGNNRRFIAGEEVEAELFESRSQRLDLRMGFPVSRFFRVILVVGFNFNENFSSSDGQQAIDEFNMANPDKQLVMVLPQDHILGSAGIRGEFNRRGYTVRLEATQHQRSKWESFGLFDQNSGQFGTIDPATGQFIPDPEANPGESFATWKVTGFKEWFLPKFQKVRAEVNYIDGAGLDRFSEFGLSFFGEDRLNGFSGASVRYDLGFFARTGYSFNLLEVIRFDVNLETARLRSTLEMAEFQSFTGIGISANVIGPWTTIWNLNYGYGLQSDIPGLDGQHEFLLLILKLF